jgi:hypothetical protein
VEVAAENWDAASALEPSCQAATFVSPVAAAQRRVWESVYLPLESGLGWRGVVAGYRTGTGSAP